MRQDPKASSPEVGLYGGSANQAGLVCDCGEEFLTTGGSWGDAPSDRPAMPLNDLVALLVAHGERCS